MISIDSLAFNKACYQLGQGVSHFDEISFEFPLNEIVLVDGDAGSGKSLLLKAMAGLVLPTQGEYLINGTNVSALSFAKFVPYRLNIGYSFEHGGLISNKTVYENLMLPLQYHRSFNGPAAVKQVEELLDQFGLTEVRDLRPAELSSSYRRLSVVARSLILEPELLLLDHPTTGLCNADRFYLADLIKQKKAEGKLKHVFIISRQEAFLENLITYRIETKNGGVFHCQ